MVEHDHKCLFQDGSSDSTSTCTVVCESTTLLSHPYFLNFGNSLVANEQALIFMSFLDH